MLLPPDLRGTYRSDLRARAAYAEAAGIYRILPQAVSLPADSTDLVRLLRWASEHRVSLVPRGAGSAMGGGNVGEGVIVDLTRMERRLQLDPEGRRARTSASVTLGDLNTVAGRHGLRLPPDPSSGAWATLGGMLSTNAAGARSVRYGSVRSWVEGLTMVSAEGETITLRREQSDPLSASAALERFQRDAAPAIRQAAALVSERFPHTSKNSSGYALDAYLATGDVLDLVIGAEGTLGIVTEIEWKLDSIPPHRGGLRVDLSSLDRIAEAVMALERYRPSALELLDRSFLDLVGMGSAGSEATLLVELESADVEDLQQGLSGAAAAVKPWATSVETAFSVHEAERLWSIRHAASPILAGLPENRRSLQVIEDACVPLERLGEYVRVVREAASKRDLPVVMFGHAGNGHLHVNLLPEVARPGWEGEVSALLEEVTQAVMRLGGTPSGEHGDGRLRAPFLEAVFGLEVMELFRQVKHAFDPAGILNPGVILPSGEPSISRLKVGDSAVAIPADVQRALREIERGGGYARCRLELAGEESAVGSQESGVRSQE